MTHPPRLLTAPVLALLLLASSCSTSSSPPPPPPLLHVPSPAWEEQVIYFVMTDRFANGDRGNDDQKKGEFDPADKDKYSGGDLQGLIDRLDYVQGLGATAVWITPPVANMWWDPLAGSGGYHGYWARDLKHVDEHLGTLDTYKALSGALHARGMYLVQDVVPNHMGNFFTYDPVASYDPNNVTTAFRRNLAAAPTAAPTQPPFDLVDATDPAQRARAIYHWTPPITDYLDPTQEVTYQVSDLDDLDTSNPEVRTALKDSYSYWIKEVGVDAFRVDTVKYVEHDFWNDFFHSTDPAAPGILSVAQGTGRSRFHAFGEVFVTSPPGDGAADVKVTSYLGTVARPELPALLQFPLYSDIAAVFGGTAAPTTDLGYRVARFMDPTLYRDPYVTPTFVDNHDVTRFLAKGTDPGLAQALTFIFTMPGIPIVYYGTEQGFTETRAAMFKGGYKADADHFDTTAPGYQRLKALAALRKGNKVFTHGTVDVLCDNPGGAGPFVYRRSQGGEVVLVLLNTSDARALVTDLPTGLPAGTVLEVLYAEQGATAPEVGAGGRITAVLPARAILVVRATSTVVTPTPPGATITVDTPIAGQVFSDDVTITGHVTPATARFRMVVDGQYDVITGVPVAADGSWSIVLPVSGFPVGRQDHTLAFYSPPTRASTPTWRFTSDVVFDPVVTTVSDPVGDDRGPIGTYTYPTDSTFGHQQDLVQVKIEAASTTMRLSLTMADWSTTWNPPNGFDHVAFNLFFEVPGQPGATVLPLLDAPTPAGFTWRYDQTTYGFGNTMYRSDGATASTPGAVDKAPTVSVDAATRTAIFTYNRNDYGLATWSGVRLYITTWDIDGIQNVYRALGPTATTWTYGGGAVGEPRIMDDAGPILIP